MKKLLGRLVILGAVVGGVVAVGGYLRGGAAAKDVAQVTFDDGSSTAFASNNERLKEFADIARKLVEMGV